MPIDPFANAVETFSAPIESLIAALGQGVAQAQQALDRNSIQTQASLDTDPILSQYGLQATWYQFPTVSMQLKLSLAMAQDQSPSQAPQALKLAPASLSFGASLIATRLVAQPLSASFQSQFNYDAQAATQINLTLVPVPPPKSSNQVGVPPRMTQAAVLAAALASPVAFIKSKDTNGNAIPAAVDVNGNTLNVLINFNSVSRIWYVIQYAPLNATVAPVVAMVDDGSGSVQAVSN
jgi:hypothetical protein